MTPQQLEHLIHLYRRVEESGVDGGQETSSRIEDLERFAAKFVETPTSCGHKWVHMEVNKQREYSGYQTRFTRTDTFFCEKCLDYKRVVQDDYSRETPDWY